MPYKSISGFFICGLLFSSVVSAASLYKYRDSNGRWVMTDKKPAREGVQEEPLVFTQAQAKVTVVNRGSNERPVLFAVNQLYGPVQIRLEFLEQENVRLSEEAPLAWQVEGPGDQYLLQLQPQSPGKSWRYQWRYEYVPGPALKDLPPLPIVPSPLAGGPYPITQGFHGAASHSEHVQSLHAVDVAVPPGTPVLAVSDGRVMDLERDFSRSGWQREYADEANFVRVLHEDGTMALYAHLQPEGIEVVAGQRVKVGQVLAYSGNTGYSSGPHLHFALQVNHDQLLQSIPFEFIDVGRPPRRGDVLVGVKPVR